MCEAEDHAFFRMREAARMYNVNSTQHLEVQHWCMALTPE